MPPSISTEALLKPDHEMPAGNLALYVRSQYDSTNLNGVFEEFCDMWR